MSVSTKLSRKEMQQRERGRRKLIWRLIWSAVIALIVVGFGYKIWQSSQPKLGVAVPEMAAQHIKDGEQHEKYNSDPPTSGPHYAQPTKAGFYDEALPDETLVHNLEHGYVVIWYNCTGLDDKACSTLKTKIHEVMDSAGRTKLIAVPRPSLSGLIAATTWGRLYKSETFNADELLEFIKEFRYKAPEPSAP